MRDSRLACAALGAHEHARGWLGCPSRLRALGLSLDRSVGCVLTFISTCHWGGGSSGGVVGGHGVPSAVRCPQPIPPSVLLCCVRESCHLGGSTVTLPRARIPPPSAPTCTGAQARASGITNRTERTLRDPRPRTTSMDLTAMLSAMQDRATWAFISNKFIILSTRTRKFHLIAKPQLGKRVFLVNFCHSCEAD